MRNSRIKALFTTIVLRSLLEFFYNLRKTVMSFVLRRVASWGNNFQRCQIFISIKQFSLGKNLITNHYNTQTIKLSWKILHEVHGNNSTFKLLPVNVWCTCKRKIPPKNSFIWSLKLQLRNIVYGKVCKFHPVSILVHVDGSTIVSQNKSPLTPPYSLFRSPW